MGLYGRLLEERAQEEERRRGSPLSIFYRSDSPVLGRLLADAPKDQPPGYAVDLATMRRLITRGVHSLGAGKRLRSLRNRYPEEYAELVAGARGQGELLYSGLR